MCWAYLGLPWRISLPISCIVSRFQLCSAITPSLQYKAHSSPVPDKRDSLQLQQYSPAQCNQTTLNRLNNLKLTTHCPPPTQIVAIYASVYVIFMWIYNAVANEPVYAALDLDNPSSLRWYFVLPLLLTGSFFLVYFVAGLREFFGRGRFECCEFCPCAVCQPEYG